MFFRRLAAYLPALLYRAAVAARADAYRKGFLETVRLPVPVFCVGNLTVGGTGKTPGVIWLADFLKARGRRPAVVTRGYGRRGTGICVVSDGGKSGPRLAPASEEHCAGDEPALIAMRLPGVPVVAAEDRVLAAEQAVALGADCLVMDDGFQHFRLHRDLDLVCLDAMFPVQEDQCLPAGRLREPVSALRRADVIFLTKANLVSEDDLAAWGRFLAAEAPGVPVATVRYEVSPDFRGARVLTLTGLARPESFEEALRRQGAEVKSLRYPDHHVFTAAERDDATRRAVEEGRILLVTEKDRQRLPSDFPCVTARLAWIPEERPAFGEARPPGEGRPDWLNRIESLIS